MRTLFRYMLAALAALAFVPSTYAQGTYPNHEIKIIVAFAPGGPTDIFARVLGERLREELGAPVIVENRPGAGNIIALQALQSAQPDGYTLAIATTAIIAQPFITKAFKFDLLNDFTPISYLVEGPLVAYVNPKLNVNNFREFVEYAKSHQGKLNYADPGESLLSVGRLMKMAGVEMTRVPYKGSGPSIQALMADEVQFMIDSTISSKPFMDSGKIKPIGLSSGKPYPAMPQLEVIGKTTVPGFRTAQAWNGLMGPKGMPPALVQRISAASQAAINHPDVRKRMAEWGMDIVPGGPEVLLENIRDTLNIYRGAAQMMNFEPQ